MNRRKTAKDRTDWARVDAFREGDPIPYDPEDGPYDPNDVAAAKAWLEQAIVVRRPGQRGPQKAPTKVPLNLRLSQDVVEHFRSTGPGWQTRIDNTLRTAIAHKKVAK